MICKSCGNNNSDAFKFCQFCGSALASDVSPKPPEALSEPRQATVTIPDSLDAWLLDDDSPSLLDAIDTEDAHAIKNDARPSASAANTDAGCGSLSFESTLGLAEKTIVDSTHEVDSAHENAELRVNLTNNSHERICRCCGDIVAKGHRFCGSCGTKFDENQVDSNKNEDSADAGNRRTVERPSFVFNSATPIEQKVARFQLVQINDDGTLGDDITLYEGENTIGRISSPALNNDRFINPKHVRITCHDDVAIVEDNNSLNGVFLRLSRTSAAIFDGDTFRVGEELLNYCHGASNQPLLSNKGEEETKLIGGKEGEGWAYLRVILGAFDEGSVYRLSKDKVTLGRTSGDIVFARDGFVSGTHAMLELDGDHAVLTDLGSSNGTFLRIKAPLTVTDSAHILIGNKLLRISKK